MAAALKSLTGLTCCLALFCTAATAQSTGDAATAAAPRERLSFNDSWRFQKDDPPGLATSLLYDVRPEVKEVTDGVPADALLGGENSGQPGSGTSAVLKPWILPTGNAFVKDPARRSVRPAGDPGRDVAYVQTDFDDSTWRPVTLPHDWAIEGPFVATGDFGGMGRLPSWGPVWYRKKFALPAADAARSVFLEIDGAMSYAAVWLNGHLVGGWPYGYASWQLDLTPYLKFGAANQLAIRLDNPPASARWYPGAGLYRNVWLTKTGPVRVGQWGTCITTRDVSADSATIDLRITLANAGPAAAPVRVVTELFSLDAAGHPTGAAVTAFPTTDTSVPATGATEVHTSLVLAHPRLWGPPPQQTPQRYVAVTTVSRDGQPVDRYETRFGIRALRFEPDQGLFINGERIAIHGVNQHHDLGALGAAFNGRAAERQLELLREMGCNAIRLSHNPPAPELLELTDRLGFLVLDEIFDSWERRKTPLDFALIFRDWHEQDLRAFLRRDRNHPSVIIWSVGNEVVEQHHGDEAGVIAHSLVAIAHEEDPTRPVTCAMNFAKPSMALPAELDLIGLNYQGEGIRQDPEFEGTTRIRTAPQYDAFHARFPDKVILSTETASAFSTRGSYLFPVTDKESDIVRDGRGGDSTNLVVSSYELHAVDFGSSVDKVFRSLARHPFVAGEFVWTGWDHLGEPTPYYAARSAYAGSIDLAGFKKDRFYLYQSHWRPELPMAHLLPHWTWPERVGQITPVHVFTSGDEAELFLNGRSLGRKEKGPFEYRLRWDDVVYEPGTLEVVAYKNGRRWATDTVKTAGAPAALELTPDRATITGDGADLCFVTVRIVDATGATVPRTNHPITFTVAGPGEIVATDNGDPTSFEPFASPARRAFNGLCLAIIRAKRGHAGTIRVTATAEGLQLATTSLTVSP